MRSRKQKRRSQEGDSGLVYVIVQSGMAPHKLPDRMPIGAAIVASSSRGHQRLSNEERQRANRFAAKGIVKWVNYPKLRRSILRPTNVEVFVDQGSIPSGVALDVETAAAAAYEDVKGSLIAAAIVRMITRAVVGGVTESVVERQSNSAVGLLVGLLVEGTMTAADTPDTRSWDTLPGRFYIARARVKTGKNTVRIRTRGRTHKRTVTIDKGQIKVLNFSALR